MKNTFLFISPCHPLTLSPCHAMISTMAMATRGFSWEIFLSLFAIFAASLMMFLLLVRRWTTRRQWTSLAEWARQRQFRMRPRKGDELPPVLEPLQKLNARLRLSLLNEEATLIQVDTEAPAQPGSNRPQRNAWNLLIRRRVKRAANPAGLRPVNAAASAVDLFGLLQYPSLGAGKRFTVLSTTPTDARALADSASKTL